MRSRLETLRARQEAVRARLESERIRRITAVIMLKDLKTPLEEICTELGVTAEWLRWQSVDLPAA